MDLAIRITRSYESITEWVEKIECDKLIAFEHDADEDVSRTHVHLLVINSVCKPDALKARFKKLYENIDAKDWSFKKYDGNSVFITYMSKGVLYDKFKKGYTDAEIDDYRAKWVVPKTNVKLEDGKLVRDVNEPNQKTKLQLLEQMRSRICDTDTTRDILKHIRYVLMQNKVVIGQYKMMDYYDSILMYDRKEDWITGMVAKINSKYGI